MNSSLPPMDIRRLAPAAGSRLLVVGGCGGIGRRLVAAAVSCDLRVAVLDRSLALSQFPPMGGVLVLEADAVDPAQVDGALEKLDNCWNGLDGLVNLAGCMGNKHPVTDFPTADWAAIFDASYRTTLNVCRAAASLLVASEREPAIVNMSSGIADLGQAGYGPYATAKAGVVTLSKILARELAPRVRCNVVSPGAIDTEFLRGGTGGTLHTSALRIDIDAYARLVPLARIGVAEDVVGPILFLLSSAARYITGQVLHIDGGALMTG